MQHQYYLPILIGAWGLTLWFLLILLLFISYLPNRGSGRAIADHTPPADEQVKPGDGRRT
ncbi:hypothetical protein [Planktothrix tepida]|uniref:hypothetical protein n=1 Tax=Planktothrix tepida TaxID=1678309 RepID=UPI0009328842|nr:hypothetical protein [Planktothrix tepida]